MCEIRNEEHIFSFFECKWGGLPEDGEDNFCLSLFIDAQNVSILSHAINLLLNYYWAS